MQHRASLRALTTRTFLACPLPPIGCPLVDARAPFGCPFVDPGRVALFVAPAKLPRRIGLMSPGHVCRPSGTAAAAARGGDRGGFFEAIASYGGKPRRRTVEDELTHPLLGDQPTLQLLTPRDEVGEPLIQFPLLLPWEGSRLRVMSTKMHAELVVGHIKIGAKNCQGVL